MHLLPIINCLVTFYYLTCCLLLRRRSLLLHVQCASTPVFISTDEPSSAQNQILSTADFTSETNTSAVIFPVSNASSNSSSSRHHHHHHHQFRAAASTDPMLSKWPRRFRIPYTFEQREGAIAYNDQEQDMIRSAMQQVTQDLGGCVQFHPYNRRFDRGHDFLYITKKGDAFGNAAQVCFTFSGRNVQQQGYGQALILFSGPSGCLQETRDVMRFMTMVLGLRGEAQRSDRDEHIKVYPENILQSLRNYNLYIRYRTDENTLIGPYDYKSITHPDASMYAVPGQRVYEILSNVNNKSVGDLPRLSYLDCLTLNILYACDHQCADPYNDRQALSSATVSPSRTTATSAFAALTNNQRRPPTGGSTTVNGNIPNPANSNSFTDFLLLNNLGTGGAGINNNNNDALLATADASNTVHTIMSFPDVVSIDTSLSSALESALSAPIGGSGSGLSGLASPSSSLSSSSRPRPARPLVAGGVGFQPPNLTQQVTSSSSSSSSNGNHINEGGTLLDVSQPMNNICSPMFQVGAAVQTANGNIYIFSSNRDAFYHIDALGFVLGGPFSVEQTGRFAVPLGGGVSDAPSLMPPIQIAWTDASEQKLTHLVDSNGNEFTFHNERFLRHNGSVDSNLAITDQDVYWAQDAPIIVTDRGTSIRIGQNGSPIKVEHALPTEATGILPAFIDALFVYIDPTTDARVVGVFAGFQFYQATPELAPNDVRLRVPPSLLVDLKRWPVRRDELIRRC